MFSVSKKDELLSEYVVYAVKTGSHNYTAKTMFLFYDKPKKRWYWDIASNYIIAE